MSETINEAPERIILRDPETGLEIRQLIEDDAQLYFDLVDYDRPHLSQFGDETAQKYSSVSDVARSILQPANPAKYRFGIWDENTMVGSINLTPQPDDQVEIGWWVGKQHTGRGYAQRAARLLIEYALEELQAKKVVAFIKNGNEASRKTAEAAGLKLGYEDEYEWIYSKYALTESEA